MLGSGLDSCSGHMYKKDHSPRTGAPTSPGAIFWGRAAMQTTFISDRDIDIALRLLLPQNRLICELALVTGLRIGDAVAIRSAQLKPRPTIREAKTGKSRRIYIPAQLLKDIKAQAGAVWAFPGRRGSALGHKSRQAVWADLKRAAIAARIPGNIGPHSLRKAYAVRIYREKGSLHEVQKALNHEDPAVTLIYAMADQLSQRRRPRRKPRRASQG